MPLVMIVCVPWEFQRVTDPMYHVQIIVMVVLKVAEMMVDIKEEVQMGVHVSQVIKWNVLVIGSQVILDMKIV